MQKPCAVHTMPLVQLFVFPSPQAVALPPAQHSIDVSETAENTLLQSTNTHGNSNTN